MPVVAEQNLKTCELTRLPLPKFLLISSFCREKIGWGGVAVYANANYFQNMKTYKSSLKISLRLSKSGVKGNCELAGMFLIQEMLRSLLLAFITYPGLTQKHSCKFWKP